MFLKIQTLNSFSTNPALVNIKIDNNFRFFMSLDVKIEAKSIPWFLSKEIQVIRHGLGSKMIIRNIPTSSLVQSIPVYRNNSINFQAFQLKTATSQCVVLYLPLSNVQCCISNNAFLHEEPHRHR